MNIQCMYYKITRIDIQLYMYLYEMLMTAYVGIRQEIEVTCTRT